jgi:CheY-like chemotaxis protein
MAKCVAVVDDDRALLDLLFSVLANEGYDVHVFDSAIEAILHLPDLQPDAVILDLRMGRRVDGWRVLDQIKGDPAIASTHVLVCSADLVQLRAVRAGANRNRFAILGKPFELETLLQLVRQMVDEPAGNAQGAATH